MYIVIVGLIHGPKTYHGPFDDLDQAYTWAGKNAEGQHYEVVPLKEAIIEEESSDYLDDAYLNEQYENEA